MEFYFSRYTSLDAGVSPVGVWLCSAILIVFLAVCAYTDGTRAKIYNKVTFPAMLAGIVINGIFGGTQGLMWALIGWGVGMAIQWIPFMLGLAKAGDVKLLAAVGALQGWTFCVFGFLYGAAAFGVLSLPWLLRHGELSGVGRNIKNYMALAVMTQRDPGAPTPTVTKKFVPWGVALSAGFFIALAVQIVCKKPFWFSF